MTHICLSILNTIGSDNVFPPDRRQAIIWTNAGILLIGPVGTNFSEILIEILIFSIKKMRLNVSSAKMWQFRLGLNVLMTYGCQFYKFHVTCLLCFINIEWVRWWFLFPASRNLQTCLTCVCTALLFFVFSSLATLLASSTHKTTQKILYPFHAITDLWLKTELRDFYSSNVFMIT